MLDQGPSPTWPEDSDGKYRQGRAENLNSSRLQLIDEAVQNVQGFSGVCTGGNLHCCEDDHSEFWCSSNKIKCVSFLICCWTAFSGVSGMLAVKQV